MEISILDRYYQVVGRNFNHEINYKSTLNWFIRLINQTIMMESYQITIDRVCVLHVIEML